MPPVRRVVKNIGGSDSAMRRSQLTAASAGGGTISLTSRACGWQIPSATATVAPASAAAAAGGGPAAAGAASAATATETVRAASEQLLAGDRGGGRGSKGSGVIAEGGWDDHRGGPPRVSSPSLPAAAWPSMVLPGGRLPPFQQVFPANGAAESAGHAKRARPVSEDEEEEKFRRSDETLKSVQESDGRASKRRSRTSTWGGSTGGRATSGGGADGGGGWSGWISLPAPASLSPTTEGCGGTPWGSSAVEASIGSGLVAAATVTAASTGATTPAWRRRMPTASTPVGTSSPSAAPMSRSPPSVWQRMQYWSTVLAETSGGGGRTRAGHLEAKCSPVEPSPSMVEVDGWGGWAKGGGSPVDSVGRVGATTAPAGEVWHAATSVGGARLLSEGANVGSSSGGESRSDVGEGQGAKGGPDRKERSFGLKARILDRSGGSGSGGDWGVRRAPLSVVAPAGGGLPIEGRRATSLEVMGGPLMGVGSGGGGTDNGGDGGGGNIAERVGNPSDFCEGACIEQSPTGSAQAVSRGRSSQISSASAHIRRVAPSSIGEAVPRQDMSGGGRRGPTLYGTIGGGGATAGISAQGRGSYSASVAPAGGRNVHGAVLKATDTTAAGTASASAAAATTSGSAAAASAVAGRRPRRLAPAPPSYRHHPTPMAAALSPSAQVGLQAYANERPYACATCPIAFKRRYDLQQHHLAVHEKRRPFACPVCGAAFSHAGTRSKHVRTVHDKVKPFPCDTCDMRFSERGNLSKHRQRLHG